MSSDTTNPHIGQDALAWINQHLASDEIQPRLAAYYREAVLAHFYAQAFHHQDAHLVLNHQGAKRLLEAINQALQSDRPEAVKLETADGEGYTLHLLVTDAFDTWEQLELPYTEDDLKGDGDSLTRLFSPSQPE